MSKVIIFPTDTVYGIGCDIFDLEGIERIYKIKRQCLFLFHMKEKQILQTMGTFLKQNILFLQLYKIHILK